MWHERPYCYWKEVSKTLRAGDRCDESVRLAIARMSDDADDYADILFPPMQEPRESYLVYAHDNPKYAIAECFTINRERYPASTYRIKTRKPTKRARATYVSHELARNLAHDEYKRWAREGEINPTLDFRVEDTDIRDISEWSEVYQVVWTPHNMPIAIASVWEGLDEDRVPGECMIWKVNVRDEFKRRGVGTKLYDHIEHQLTKRGLRLRPSHLLSDEGRAFWAKRDPIRLLQRFDHRKKKSAA